MAGCCLEAPQGPPRVPEVPRRQLPAQREDQTDCGGRIRREAGRARDPTYRASPEREARFGQVEAPDILQGW